MARGLHLRSKARRRGAGRVRVGVGERDHLTMTTGPSLIRRVGPPCPPGLLVTI